MQHFLAHVRDTLVDAGGVVGVSVAGALLVVGPWLGFMAWRRRRGGRQMQPLQARIMNTLRIAANPLLPGTIAEIMAAEPIEVRVALIEMAKANPLVIHTTPSRAIPGAWEYSLEPGSK